MIAMLRINGTGAEDRNCRSASKDGFLHEEHLRGETPVKMTATEPLSTYGLDRNAHLTKM
jgi:hypothetical protein